MNSCKWNRKTNKKQKSKKMGALSYTFKNDENWLNCSKLKVTDERGKRLGK